MDMDETREDYYIIPHNYTDNGKILGIIEVQSVYLAACWFLPTTVLNFWLIPLGLDYKLFIFVLVILPPTAIALLGIGSDTILDFAKYVRNFYKRSKVYTYEK